MDRRDALKTAFTGLCFGIGVANNEAAPVSKLDISVPEPPVPVSDDFCTTGIPSLDRMLGGGFKRGEIHTIIGASGTAKIAFVEQLALENPYKIVFTDLDKYHQHPCFEGNPDRMKALIHRNKYIDLLWRRCKQFNLCHIISYTTMAQAESNVMPFYESQRVHLPPSKLAFMSSTILELRKISDDSGRALREIEIRKNRYGLSPNGSRIDVDVDIFQYPMFVDCYSDPVSRREFSYKERQNNLPRLTKTIPYFG